MRDDLGPYEDVVDPPTAVIAAGAQGDDRAPVETAAGGGTSGFIHLMSAAGS